MIALRKAGIPETDVSIVSIRGLLGELVKEVGRRVARIPLLLKPLKFWSPAGFALFLDPELGWMVEIRDYKEALPRYKIVSDEIAVALIKEEVTKELELELMTPDPYIGE